MKKQTVTFFKVLLCLVLVALAVRCILHCNDLSDQMKALDMNAGRGYFEWKKLDDRFTGWFWASVAYLLTSVGLGVYWFEDVC